MQDERIKEGLQRNRELLESCRDAYFNFDGHISGALVIVTAIFMAVLEGEEYWDKLIFILLSISIGCAAAAMFLLRHGIGEAQKHLMRFLETHDDLDYKLSQNEIGEIDYLRRSIMAANDTSYMDVVGKSRSQFEALVLVSMLLTSFSIGLTVINKIFF
jgi:hypothetical protein